jgi:carboxymethylenebutenolidase
VIGFYGLLEPRRAGKGERPSLLEHGDEMRVPVLGLFGGEDQTIPPEDVEEFERALEGAGVPHELVTYPGAPHSFFDRKFDEHAEASEDAWRRVVDFLERLPAPSA